MVLIVIDFVTVICSIDMISIKNTLQKFLGGLKALFRKSDI